MFLLIEYMVRFTLFAFFLLYFAVAFLFPSYRVWMKTGVNPVTFRGGDSAHDYIGKVFKRLMLGLAAVVTINAFLPEADQFLLPIFWLKHPYIELTGFVLLLLSLVWTITAQVQMGNSWRIGVDRETKTDLVSSGVFSISRNPIFLGMIVTMFALLLALPTAFTLVAFVVGVTLLQIQVRLEEEFLSSRHSEDYEAYKRAVRRWL